MTLYKTEFGKLFNDATGQFSDPITESGGCSYVTSWFEQLPSFEHTQWYRDLKPGDEIEFLSPYPDRWGTCIVAGRDNNDQVVREYAPGMTVSVPMKDARPVRA